MITENHKIKEICILFNNEIEKIVLAKLRPYEKSKMIEDSKRNLLDSLEKNSLRMDDVLKYPLEELVKSVDNKVSAEYYLYCKEIESQNQQKEELKPKDESEDAQSEESLKPCVDEFSGIIYLQKKSVSKDFLSFFNLMNRASSCVFIEKEFEDLLTILMELVLTRDEKDEDIIRFIEKLKERVPYLTESFEKIESIKGRDKMEKILYFLHEIDGKNDYAGWKQSLNFDSDLEKMKLNAHENILEWNFRSDENYLRVDLITNILRKTSPTEELKILAEKSKNEYEDRFKKVSDEIEKNKSEIILSCLRKYPVLNEREIGFYIQNSKFYELNPFNLRPNAALFLDYLSFFEKATPKLISTTVEKFIINAKKMITSFLQGFIWRDEMEMMWRRSCMKIENLLKDEKELGQTIVNNILHLTTEILLFGDYIIKYNN